MHYACHCVLGSLALLLNCITATKTLPGGTQLLKYCRLYLSCMLYRQHPPSSHSCHTRNPLAGMHTLMSEPTAEMLRSTEPLMTVGIREVVGYIFWAVL